MKFVFILFVVCSVAWAQEQSPSPVPSSVQPVGEISSTAQPEPPAQDSSPSSPPAQEPRAPPQEESTAAPAQNPSSPPAVPPPEEEQGAQSGDAITIPAGLITVTVAPQTSPTTTPTTTTQPPTTTTPAPKPVPTISPFPQNIGNWSIQEKGRKGPCLMINAAMQLHVKGQNVSVDVPSSEKYVTVEGDCGEADVQNLSLSWYANVTAPKLFYNKLTLRFSKLGDGNYGLSTVTYEYNAKDETPKKAIVDASFFATTLKNSYRCHSEQRVETDDGTLTLLTSNLQFEAFRDDTVNSTVYSAADECKADHRTSTAVVVGIGFGIGLLIVVCIALGIYLIKRFRNREGYQPLDSHN